MARDVDTARRSPVTEQLSGMLADLAAATSQKAQAEVRLARVQALKVSPQLAMTAIEVAGSEVIRDLIGREAAARQRIADLRSTYGERHPTMAAAIAEANELRTRINIEANRVLEAAAQDYERASSVAEHLSVAVARQQSRAGAEQIKRVRLRDLERRAKTVSDLHAAFMRATQEAIERASLRVPLVQLVARAIPPERPSFPSKRVMLPAGLVASLSLACLAAIVLELRRFGRSFVDPAELEQVTGLPLQGAIPHIRRPSAFPCPEELTLGDRDHWHAAHPPRPPRRLAGGAARPRVRGHLLRPG